MKLKELEKLLRGSIKFKLQARVEEEIETLDEVLIYEIKYLPAGLLRREVLEIDLDENIIFLDKDKDSTVIKHYTSMEEDFDFCNNNYEKLEDSSLI